MMSILILIGLGCLLLWTFAQDGGSEAGDGGHAEFEDIKIESDGSAGAGHS